MAHVRQSRPDSGLGFQAKVLKYLKLSPLRSEAARENGRRGGRPEEDLCHLFECEALGQLGKDESASV